MVQPNEWYDAGIVGGEEVDQEILRQLAKADLILLLLSPSYINSDYCWNKELPAALRFRQQGNARVVGIVVEPVHLKGLEFSHHKLLPKDMKPIPHWHPQSEGWNDVCKGIEQVIDDLHNPSPVDDALNVPKSIVTAASASQGSRSYDPARDAQPIESVADFWALRGSTVTPGCLVSLQGTFSQFAPMLMGHTSCIERHAKDFIPPQVTDELCHEVYGLVVDGDNTNVERRGAARYLDGDIWIAVESEGLEKLLTVFLNVASPKERKEEIDVLYQKAQRLPGQPRIMAQYDDDHEFAPEFGTFDTKNQFLDSIWQFGFGKRPVRVP